MVAALSEHYHWPPDAWRRLGWREFRGWMRELHAARDRAAGRGRTSPESWAGKEQDPFWAEQRKKHKRIRG